MVDRILAVVGDTDGKMRTAKLRAFRQFVLLHGAVRSWLWLVFFGFLDPLRVGISAGILTPRFGFALVPKAEHTAPRLALPVLLLQIIWTFPFADNHFFIEVVSVVLLCLIDRDREGDEVLALQGLRWMAVIILFHTGLQKVLYGHYFQGDFLAFMVGIDERFSDLFQFLLPADEVARLQSYNPMRSGDGPYRVDFLPFVLASNAIYVAEMVLPLLLMIRQTRTVAALASIVLVLAIQLGAREAGFAFLFTNLLLLFLPADVNRKLLPGFGLIYLYVLGAVLGFLPGKSLIEARYL